MRGSPRVGGLETDLNPDAKLSSARLSFYLFAVSLQYLALQKYWFYFKRHFFLIAKDGICCFYVHVNLDVNNCSFDTKASLKPFSW